MLDFLILAKGPHYGVKCDSCWWQDSSANAYIHNGELHCPECVKNRGTIEKKSSLTRVFYLNPLFFLLHFTAGKIKHAKERHDHTAFLKWAEEVRLNAEREYQEKRKRLGLD